jgi:hypothetical protein
MNTTEFLEDEVPSDRFPCGLKEGAEPSATPQCEKCGAPLAVHDTLACRSCGWYASIGAFIEIDKVWEASADPEMEYEPEAEPEAEKIPTWAWVLVGCLAVVVVESFIGRFTTPADSAARTTWSLTQLGIGFLAFAVCHFVCFGRLMAEQAETNLLDFVLSPVKCWALAIGELPRRQWMFDGAASGLTAVAMSLVVIGGIPYHRLLDWGFKQPPKQNLMAAVLSQAQKIEGEEKSLEEAIEDFAGTQNLDELDQDGNPKDDPKPAPRKETDCVVLGFLANDDGLAYSLILGVEHNTRLVYCCRVSPQLPEEELRALTDKLSGWKTRKPYVKLDLEATWVVPKQVCRVSYLRQGDNGWLYNAEFKGLRGEMNISGL